MPTAVMNIMTSLCDTWQVPDFPSYESSGLLVMILCMYGHFDSLKVVPCPNRLLSCR